MASDYILKPDIAFLEDSVEQILNGEVVYLFKQSQVEYVLNKINENEVRGKLKVENKDGITSIRIITKSTYKYKVIDLIDNSEYLYENRFQLAKDLGLSSSYAGNAISRKITIKKRYQIIKI